ncbi:MAG: hypothetical protein ACK2UO_12830 [Caldilineaceae bacterium]
MMTQKPNRSLAVLAYVIPIVGPALALLFDRKNVFALYHACQGLMVTMLAVFLPVLWLVVSWAIAWVPMAGPTLGAASFTIVVAAIVLAFALAVAGVVNVLGERMAPLFLVGRRGERLFVRLYPEPVVESSS